MTQKPRMNVLVTRPLAQAQPMIDLLQEQGFGVYHQPCLDITPVQPNTADGLQSKQWAMNLDTFDHVIVISTNAARFWLDLIQDYWPQWPVGIRWWSMGETTQGQLNVAGIESDRPSTGDTSEDLLADMLPQIKAHEKVLIVRGCGGRETLYDALVATGAQVSYAQCYKRTQPQISNESLLHLGRFAPQAVVLQSGETLANFNQLLADQVWCDKQNIILVVPSERVAAQGRLLGFQKVYSSNGASNQTICDTLLQQSELFG